MVNDSSFRALSHWQHVYGDQIKKRQAEPNRDDSQFGIFYPFFLHFNWDGISNFDI